MAGREEDRSREQVSQLLAAWTTGDSAARDDLLPVVYAERQYVADSPAFRPFQQLPEVAAVLKK